MPEIPFYSDCATSPYPFNYNYSYTNSATGESLDLDWINIDPVTGVLTILENAPYSTTTTITVAVLVISTGFNLPRELKLIPVENTAP